MTHKKRRKKTSLPRRRRNYKRLFEIKFEKTQKEQRKKIEALIRGIKYAQEQAHLHPLQFD